jgi:hypothetical protein
LLVGGTSTLYEKKVHAPDGSKARRRFMPLVLCFFVATASIGVLWCAPSQSAAQDERSSVDVASPSPAVPSPSSTTWAVRVTPGSRCEGSEWFTDAVSAQIPVAQRAPVDRAELVADVSIEESGIARIRVFDRLLQAEAGARELPLDTRSCAENAEAVSLVLAVLVEAGRGALGSATAAPAKPPDPLPATPAEPAAPEPVPAASPSAPRRAARHAWLGPRAGHDLVAAAGVGGGLLPGPALAGTLGWGIRGAKTWPIWLQVTGLKGRESRAVPARFRALYGGLLGCPFTKSWSRLRARACAGGALGAVWSEGHRLATNYQKTNPVVLLGLELALSLRLIGALEFTVLGRGDASLYRTSAYYDGANGTRPRIYEPSIMSGSVFAGLALRFR